MTNRQEIEFPSIGAARHYLAETCRMAYDGPGRVTPDSECYSRTDEHGVDCAYAILRRRPDRRAVRVVMW